jgi:hypothetical protein
VNRYWLSWIQPTKDFRPLTDPPNAAILGWWCSGYDSDDNATLCAGVEAKSERSAKAAVHIDWPEAKVWRFCEAVPDDFMPSDRFPLKDWALQRWERRPSPAKEQTP